MGLWSGMGWVWMWPFLLVVAIVVTVVWVARRAPSDTRNGSAEATLKQRLARGEISVAEYRELLDELRR